MNTQVSWLLGKSLQGVRCDDETQTWGFDFGNGHVLRVASPWRFIKEGAEGAIALGYYDHRQWFGLPQPVDAEAVAYGLVKGRVVLDALVASGSADLTIDFGAGIRLEVFNASAGYEGWTLNAPGGRLFVAWGGGQLAEWSGGNDTYLLVSGWRLFFYSNEGNEPAHVHCRKGEKECKYWLDGENFDLEEAYAYNLSPRDRREIRRIIFEHFEYIEQLWDEFRRRRQR